MNKLVELAKKTVEAFIKDDKKLQLPFKIEKKVTPRRGVFVTIKKGDELMGCVGSCLPVEKNIFIETISSAVAAAQDYRFERLTLSDLPLLNYQVTIIGKPQKIRSIKKLDPSKYGVIVEDKDFRRGLLLPRLDGINSAHQQLNTACKKAGIKNKKGITVYRFKCITLFSS